MPHFFFSRGLCAFICIYEPGRGGELNPRKITSLNEDSKPPLPFVYIHTYRNVFESQHREKNPETEFLKQYWTTPWQFMWQYRNRVYQHLLFHWTISATWRVRCVWGGEGYCIGNCLSSISPYPGLVHCRDGKQQSRLCAWNATQNITPWTPETYGCQITACKKTISVLWKKAIKIRLKMNKMWKSQCFILITGTTKII